MWLASLKSIASSDAELASLFGKECSEISNGVCFWCFLSRQQRNELNWSGQCLLFALTALNPSASMRWKNIRVSIQGPGFNWSRRDETSRLSSFDDKVILDTVVTDIRSDVHLLGSVWLQFHVIVYDVEVMMMNADQEVQNSRTSSQALASLYLYSICHQ